MSGDGQTGKVLVTGGGGFIGRAIIERLLARGETVVSLTRRDHPDLRARGVEVRRGDLADAAVVKAACAGCKLVFHVAARAGLSGSWHEYHAANVGGTENVLAGCRLHGVKRLVFTSSPSVVCRGEDMAGVDESVPYPQRWLSDYSRSKALAEQKVLAANDRELKTVAIRPHLVWGPGDTNLVPRIIARASRLRRIGSANKLVDCTYIDNAADAHLLAADRLLDHPAVAGRPYFISQGEPWPVWKIINAYLAAADLPPVERSCHPIVGRIIVTLLETGHRVLGLRGEPLLTRFVFDQLTTAHWFDISAARRDLGYQPKISMEEGLRRLRAWLHGEAAAPGVEGIRIEEYADRHRDGVLAVVQEVYREYGFTWEAEGYHRDLYDVPGHYLSRGGMFWAMLEGESVIGCVGVLPREDDCELHRMYLRKSHRGRGLGRRLLDTAVTFARHRGWRRMRAWSDVKLTLAHRLYLKSGFIRDHERICDDPDQSHEYGFMKDL